MRFTDVVYKNKNDYKLCETVNILSVKMGSLDIDFPIHVYGTVIARDSLDKKSVYLFRRDREDSQTINSKVCNFVNPPPLGLAHMETSELSDDVTCCQVDSCLQLLL
jgi:hypothetical protein